MNIFRTSLKRKENVLLISILIFTGLLLAVPYIVRSINNNPTVPNSESYYHLRLYNTISPQGSLAETYHDPLQDRGVEMNILYLLPLNGEIVDILFQIMPILFGVLAVLIAYFILKHHNMGELSTWVMLVLLVISPIFLYVFTSFNMYAIIILLNLLALLFITNNKPFIAAIFLFIMPFISFYGALLSFIFLCIYIISNSSYIRKSMRRHLLVLLLFFFIILLALAVNIASGFNPLGQLSFDSENIIIDIGATVGFSFSVLVLAVIGFILLWQRGWKNILIYGLILLFTVLSFFNVYMRIYLNFILIVYAGFALLYLMRRKWSIALIKKTTLLLIICSILFSTIFYSTQLIRAQPSAALTDALTFISKQSFEEEIVYSSPENGYFIEYFSHRQAFVDPLTEFEDPERAELHRSMMVSRNLDNTTNVFDRYNIHYLVVDEGFRRQLERDGGLAFLIENSQSFHKIYTAEDVDVWLYTGKR